jgi:hypothetical protein
MTWTVRPTASVSVKKRTHTATHTANKRRKADKSIEHHLDDAIQLDALTGWRPIKFPSTMPFTDGAAGGYTMLEEIDNVHVNYVDTDHGRIIEFKVDIHCIILHTVLSCSTGCLL